MFFWEKYQVSHFAPVLPEKLVCCSPNSFSLDEKTFFRSPLFLEETQPFLFAQKLLKKVWLMFSKKIKLFSFW